MKESTPIRSNRNTLTFELAVNLRNICDSDPQLLDRIIPCYDEFPEAEKMACIRSALGEKKTQMPKRLKDVLMAVRQDMRAEAREEAEEEEALLQDDLYYYDALPKMPQGVRESIERRGAAPRHARYLRHHAGHRHARHGRARRYPRHTPRSSTSSATSQATSPRARAVSTP